MQNNYITNISQKLSDHVDYCTKINVLLSNKFTELSVLIDIYNRLSQLSEEKNSYILQLIDFISSLLHENDIDPTIIKRLVTEQHAKIDEIQDKLDQLNDFHQENNNSIIHNPLNSAFEQKYAKNPKSLGDVDNNNGNIMSLGNTLPNTQLSSNNLHPQLLNNPQDYNSEVLHSNNSKKTKKTKKTKQKAISNRELKQMQNLVKLHNTGVWKNGGLNKHHPQISNQKIKKNLNRSRKILNEHGMKSKF